MFLYLKALFSPNFLFLYLNYFKIPLFSKDPKYLPNFPFLFLQKLMHSNIKNQKNNFSPINLPLPNKTPVIQITNL
jgi:hypothetical protein